MPIIPRILTDQHETPILLLPDLKIYNIFIFITVAEMQFLHFPYLFRGELPHPPLASILEEKLTEITR